MKGNKKTGNGTKWEWKYLLYPIMKDASKSVLRGQFTAVNAYSRNEAWLWICNLNSYCMKWKKKKKIEPKQVEGGR